MYLRPVHPPEFTQKDKFTASTNLTIAFIVVNVLGNASLVYFGLYFYWMSGITMIKPKNLSSTRKRKSGDYKTVLDDL